MVIASTNAVALLINNEASWGETPSSPAMQQIRFTGESLAYNKKTVTSDTIRSDRMRDQMALVSFETTGDINAELAYFDYDPLAEAALFGTWTGARTLTATTIAFTSTGITDSANGLGDIPVNAYIWISGAAAAANNIRYRVTTSAAGVLGLNPPPASTAIAGASITISTATTVYTTVAVTKLAAVVASTHTLTFSGSTGFNPLTQTNFVVGQFINMQGFAQAANNGIKRISAITSATLVFANDTMADETVTASSNLSLTGRRLRNGVTQRSFHIQKGFTDISQYVSFRGMRVSDWKLDTQAAQIIKNTFSFMGKQAVRSGSTVAATTIATNTSHVMTGSNNVGTIYQNGAALATGVKQIQMEVNNNLRLSEQIGSLYPYAVGYGFQDVTGQVEVYFEDATLYDQLINHTSTELSWPVTDDNSNVYRITLPAIILTDGFPSAGSGNNDVMIPLNFHAIRNSTYDCQIQIDQMPSLT